MYKKFLICLTIPSVGGVVILHTGLHVLEFIQDGEHIDKPSKSEQIGLGDEVLPLLCMAQSLHLSAEPLNGLALNKYNIYIGYFCKSRKPFLI